MPAKKLGCKRVNCEYQTKFNPDITEASRTMCYPPIMAQQKQSSIKSFFSAQKRPRLATDEMEGHSEGENSDLEQDDIVGDPECSHMADDLDSDLEGDSESHGSSATVAQIDEFSSTCSSECCKSELSEPYHPSNILLSKKRQGKQNRSFQRGWFMEHKWLTYCETHHKVFCFSCRSALSRGLICVPSKGHVFVSKGFDNWKKAKERFREHERCQVHREAMQLSHQLLVDQKYRREMLMKMLSSLRFLVCQGLAIRGHREEDSNLVQLLHCRSEDIHGLESWIKDGRYLSHDIINELIEMMAHQLLRSILSEIKNATWFALIADETRDVGGLEQFAVSLRWVDKSYSIYEDVIGLVQVDQTDGATLASTLKDVLIRCGLQLSCCRGQTYDGASNMSGHLSGVASRLKAEEPRAHYVHCVAHCLNLCLQDCAHSCSCIRDALALVSELANLFRASPKRLAQFRHLKEQLYPGSPGLKPLCPTRWTVRTAAIDAILKNYSVLCEELDLLGEEAQGESSHKALGLLAMMEKFSTFFGLKLAFLVFSATEQASLTLQYKDINAQEACMATNVARNFLVRHRSDSAFHTFYQSVVSEASDYTLSPVLPRQRRVPRRIDDGTPGHIFSSPEDHYRKQYYEVMDILTEEMARRFDQAAFSLLQEMERLLIDSCNGTRVTPSSNFKEMYKNDLNMDTLNVQLSMLPDVVTTANEEHHVGIKRVTSVRTVCDIFNTCRFPKTMLGEVDHLLHLYLTIPLTSATAERTFSTLRRLKSYLRSTMTQKRLNHLILLHTFKKNVSEMNLYQIAGDFVSRNSRRTQFFGTF